MQADIEAAFETADNGQVEIDVDLDKGHGRVETRTVSVLRQIDWVDGDRSPDCTDVPLRFSLRITSKAACLERRQLQVKVLVNG